MMRFGKGYVMSKATLLVVEDEPNLLLGIRDILELDDYEVMTAHNGREALEVLEGVGESLPDLIVSDIMMPYLNGLEFLQEVRRREQWVMIPFIFLTAKGGKGDVQAGKKLGVDDYIIKPFDADDLLVAVDSRLKRMDGIKGSAADAVSDVKRDILTILNHEFRTPLTMVVAYADMLKGNSVDEMNEDELRFFMKEINNGADRIRRLIENFILLVEINTGDAHKTYEWRRGRIDDIDVILKEAARRQEAHDKYPRASKVVKLNQTPPIVGDREFLLNMFAELLMNAAKFSDEDQTIQIEIEGVEGDLHIRVIDQGRGIPPNQLKAIWDIFYQIDREVYEDQGVGSGLAIVAGIAKMHGGKVELTSAVGEGSCFTVKIPALRD